MSRLFSKCPAKQTKSINCSACSPQLGKDTPLPF